MTTKFLTRIPSWNGFGFYEFSEIIQTVDLTCFGLSQIVLKLTLKNNKFDEVCGSCVIIYPLIESSLYEQKLENFITETAIKKFW